jgi:YcaO-like protein with predicted kinase domain
VDAKALGSGETVKVPICLVARTSGRESMAAGATLQEAIVEAGYGVLANYAFNQIVIKSRNQVASIAPESLQNPQIRNALEAMAMAGLQIVIKDFTLDGQVPVIGILSINHSLPSDHVQYRRVTAAADTDLERALLKALQARLCPLGHLNAVDSGYDMSLGNAARIQHALASYLVRGLFPSNLFFLEPGEMRSITDCSALIDASPDPLADLVRICQDLHSDLLVIDHTMPGLDYPAVRVVVPAVSDLALSWEKWAGEHPIQALLRMLQPQEAPFEAILKVILG